MDPELARRNRRVRSSRTYQALARQVRRHQPPVCWICGWEIDLDLPYKDPKTGRVNPRSWSLDHVLPMSTHPELALVEQNAKVACYGCNSGRGNRAPGQARRQQPSILTTSRAW